MIQFFKALKTIIPPKNLKGCEHDVKDETMTIYITEDLTDSVCENKFGTEKFLIFNFSNYNNNNKKLLEILIMSLT